LLNRFYDAEAFVFQQKSAPSRIMRARDAAHDESAGDVNREPRANGDIPDRDLLNDFR